MARPILIRVTGDLSNGFAAPFGLSPVNSTYGSARGWSIGKSRDYWVFPAH